MKILTIYLEYGYFPDAKATSALHSKDKCKYLQMNLHQRYLHLSIYFLVQFTPHSAQFPSHPPVSFLRRLMIESTSKPATIPSTTTLAIFIINFSYTQEYKNFSVCFNSLSFCIIEQYSIFPLTEDSVTPSPILGYFIE